MLPIVDKPVIQYLVEEAVDAGIEEIIIVTGRGKRAIEDHFDYSLELEALLEKKGKTELLKETRNIPKLAKFIYVRQSEPLGDGHAILCAKEVVGNEPFAVLFGDDIVDSETPAIKQLIDVFEEKQGCVIGLEKIPKEKTESYGILEPANSEGRLHEVKSLVEKPAPEKAPSDLGIENASPSEGGEVRLIDGLIKLKETQKIYGYELEGTRYDTGEKLGLIKATINYALKRKSLSSNLKKYLRSLDLG